MHDRAGLHTVLGEIQAPERLQARVFAQLSQARRQAAVASFFRLAISSFVFTLGLILAVQYVMQAFYTSGFYDYASLYFSDPRIIASSWSQFVLTLIESLPSLPLLLLLATSGALLWSLRRLLRSARAAGFMPLYRI